MKRAIAFLVMILLAASALPVCAEPAGSVGDPVALKLKQSFPQVKPDRIDPSPIDGIYEVLAGNRIFYFAPSSGHLFVGELWQSGGKNLTKARIGSVMGEKLQTLSLNNALKIGDGPNVVIEVTDPDCPYCRKASEFFKTRTDVTRYIFFLPLQMHPEAEDKARFILSSENPAESYEAVMGGQFDNVPLPPVKDNGLLAQHREATDHLGVRGTPNFWVNGNYVSGANIQAILSHFKKPVPEPEAPGPRVKGQ